MCECLCSEVKGDIALAIEETYVSIDAYMGCQECAELVGIDVRVFTERGAREFLNGATIRRGKADDYGGPNGNTAVSFEMFSMDDLAEALQSESGDLSNTADYDGWDEFISYHGVAIMKKAFNICQKRNRNQKAPE